MKQTRLVISALLAGFVLAISQTACSNETNNAPPAGARVSQKLHLKGYYSRKAWTGGSHRQALSMALAGTTIQMAEYSFVASKDGATYSGTLVGTSPFAEPPAGSTISAIVVPLHVGIGSAVFDPGALNSCDGNVSALTRLAQSPLANDIPSLTINGVNVGNSQFVNGLRRAEFWDTIHGSAAYQNELKISFASSYLLDAATVGNHGITVGSGCGQLGVLSTDWLDAFLRSTVIPSLTSSGTISPKSVVFFLLKNVVQGTTDPPTVNANCCILGYHTAVGSPVQTYGTIDWETSGNFDGLSDASIASHEIGEWMDDPLAKNATPPWGNIGQVSGCQANWEVGDPLSGTLMPAITMNGKSYQMQELALFSWFFNKAGDPSVGAGGKFSSNGTFQRPASVCPPGGTD
jgi:hypothetical protein